MAGGLSSGRERKDLTELGRAGGEWGLCRSSLHPGIFSSAILAPTMPRNFCRVSFLLKVMTVARLSCSQAQLRDHQPCVSKTCVLQTPLLSDLCHRKAVL